jgi:prolyl-tRNA synthetase
MGKKQKTAISPTRDEDYPEWYQQVVKASDMAERAPVRGCMVIKPWGYALWENIVARWTHVQGHRREKRLFSALSFPIKFPGKRG